MSSLRILQPVLRPLRLQITPVLAEVETGLIFAVSKQSRIAQLRASIRLCPQRHSDGVGTLIVDHTRWEREASLRSDLRDELAVCKEVKMLAITPTSQQAEGVLTLVAVDIDLHTSDGTSRCAQLDTRGTSRSSSSDRSKCAMYHLMPEVASPVKGEPDDHSDPVGLKPGKCQPSRVP